MKYIHIWASDQRNAEEKEKKKSSHQPPKKPRILTIENYFWLKPLPLSFSSKNPWWEKEVRTNPRVSRNQAQSSFPKVKISWFLMIYF